MGAFWGKIALIGQARPFGAYTCFPPFYNVQISVMDAPAGNLTKVSGHPKK